VLATGTTPSSLVLGSYLNHILSERFGVCGECRVRLEERVACTYTQGTIPIAHRVELNFDTVPTGWQAPISACL
jgi:hypothetical protein